jgi:hypothetical protein
VKQSHGEGQSHAEQLKLQLVLMRDQYVLSPVKYGQGLPGIYQEEDPPTVEKLATPHLLTMRKAQVSESQHPVRHHQQIKDPS